MIIKDKNKQTISFENFGMSGKDISSLISTLSNTILNYKKEFPNINMTKVPNEELYNNWILHNPRWKNIPFDLSAEIMEYINSIKDEKGIFIGNY